MGSGRGDRSAMTTLHLGTVRRRTVGCADNKKNELCPRARDRRQVDVESQIPDKEVSEFDPAPPTLAMLP